MGYLTIAKKIQADLKPKLSTPDLVWSDPNLISTVIDNGEMVAVLLCSKILEAHVWLAFDDSFDPHDGRAVFYAHELSSLKAKTPEQLRKIFETKLAFGPSARAKQ